MDLSYLQLLQLAMLFFVVYVIGYIIVPIIKQQYIKAATKDTIIHDLYYLDFDINLKRCDFEAFQKYEIWRYILKRRELQS
jgi:hypothetical protein